MAETPPAYRIVRFAARAPKSPARNGQTRAKEVDEIWHYWILETQQYEALCLSLPIPGFIHHSSNAFLELQWYLFSAIFLLCAGYTLLRNEHIRIDIISGRLSKRARDWIDLLGHTLMLMPFAILMLYYLVPYVRQSFRNQEISGNASGLIIWPAKAILLAGFALLTLQGVSEIIKRVAVMRGAISDPMPAHHAHPIVEEQLATAPGAAEADARPRARRSGREAAP